MVGRKSDYSIVLMIQGNSCRREGSNTKSTLTRTHCPHTEVRKQC